LSVCSGNPASEQGRDSRPELISSRAKGWSWAMRSVSDRNSASIGDFGVMKLVARAELRMFSSAPCRRSVS
jgi:hypothetical protein